MTKDGLLSDFFGILGGQMYRLAEFVVDLRHQLLLQGDRRVDLTRKPFGILVYLVENRDRLVTRRELLDRFWDGKDVYDQTLTRALARIRSALGDSREVPRFIETRWASGYQYIGPFEEDVQGLLASVPGSDDALPKLVEAAPLSLAPEPFAPISRPPRPRFLPALINPTALLCLMTAFILVAATVTLVYYRSQIPLLARSSPASFQPPAVHVRKSVAIMTFKNLAGDEKDDWLGTALAEMLSTDLTADGRIRTLRGENVARVSKDLQIDRPVGLSADMLSGVKRNLSADLVVTGSYAILDPGGDAGKRVRLDVRVQDAVTGDPVASLSETGRFEQLFDIASSVGTRLLASLNLPATPASEDARSPLNAKDPEAVQDYMKGLDRYRAEDFVVAQSYFEKAIARDAGFPLAHLALADVWAARGFQEKEKAEVKLASSLSGSLDRENRLLIQARYASSIGDWEHAIDAYRALYTFFPDNADYGLMLVNAQTGAGQGKNAEATLQSLRKLPPPLRDDPRIDLAEAGAAQALSDATRAARATQRAAEKAKRSGDLLLYARALSMHAGSIAGTDIHASIRESEEARQICTRLHDVECAANILRRLGVYQVETDPDAAEANLKQALSMARSIGNLTEEDNDLNGLAAILSNKGDYRSADGMYREMLANEREMNSGWGMQMALNNLGGNLFLEGDLLEARQVQTEALTISRRIGLRAAAAYALMSLSELDLAQGSLPQARGEANQAMSVFNELQSSEPHAMSLSILGDVERAEGNLGQALKDQGQAVAALEKDGDSGSLADARMSLARSNLDAGNSEAAAKLSSLAAASFAKQNRRADEACARALHALAIMPNGRPNSNGAETRGALDMIKGTQGQVPQSEVQIETALLVARSPDSYSSSEIENTIDRMNTVDSQAQLGHFARIAIEARLASAELEVREGRDEESRRLLVDAGSQARRDGYVLLARQASSLLRRIPSQPLDTQASNGGLKPAQ